MDRPEAPRGGGFGRAWLLAALLVSVAALLLTLPRSIAYSDLMDENLSLKARLHEIDSRMDEVDRLLLRMRLYDVQLRSLAEPKGDHGPLPESAYANHNLLRARDALDTLSGDPMDDVLEDIEVHPSDLRPAETWALSVSSRLDELIRLAERAEPDVNQLVAELEDLHALEQALPTHWPADGMLTSGFGWRRSPFGWRRSGFHSGLDIANDPGTPISAASGGQVIRAEYSGGYGYMVDVDHGFGITTRYAHCSRILVKVGQTVEPGERIATVGSSGSVTGPHLHYEVRIDGHPVDPLDYLPR